jgi:diguanylate cyclase (GGDEF)-like protein
MRAFGRMPKGVVFVQILIIEDNDLVSESMSLSLELADPSVSADAVRDLQSAYERLSMGKTYDVALVDLGLPDAQGIQAPSRLKSKYPDLPIIVISGNPSQAIALDLIRLGVQDYIPKSEATPTRVLRTVALARERLEREKELASLANIDPLTGTLNRRGLMKATHDIRETALRMRWCAALMTIDVDRFKKVNDMFGHPTGDAILTECGHRLAHCVRPSDVVGRIGGDEFWVATTSYSDTGPIPRIAEKIIDRFSVPFRVDFRTIPIRVSVGIAILADPADSLDVWIAKSDRALYKAKRNLRNGWYLYEDTAEKRSAITARGRGKRRHIATPSIQPL